MSEMLNDRKYGIKICVISTLDYIDFKDILDAILERGYTITMADNGNAICEKNPVDEVKG
jgi:hypothetical protein